MTNTIKLAEKFAHSNRFQTLFQDGMRLVEECATYLDGDGRTEVKTLPRTTAMTYGSESMRLTTRLMQLASWLLLQRASNEGEMNRDQLLEEKKKIKLHDLKQDADELADKQLPEAFIELVRRSTTLQNRVLTLDAELYGNKEETPNQPQPNPVNLQIDLLSTALGANKQ